MYDPWGYKKYLDEAGLSRERQVLLPIRTAAGAAYGMQLNFATPELEALCNSSAQLDRKFGKNAPIVRLRLLCLWNAPKLRAVTIKPPDRRVLEPSHGSRAMSVCVRDAGRIYFHAGSRGSRIVGPIEEVDEIEIFAIGTGSP